MTLLIALLCVSAALIVLLLHVVGRVKRRHLPPCPPGWPIVGHLHILHLPLHQCLHKLAQSYGPIFYIKLGSTPTVVVSSPLWAREFLQVHDRDFADRPEFEASKRLFYGNRTMIMMEYGSTWRELRKLYTAQILTAKRVEAFEHVRNEEMERTVGVIRQRQNEVVDMRKLVFKAVGNMMTRVLFSERSFEEEEEGGGGGGDGQCEFKRMVEEMSELFGAPVIGDHIRWLSWLDIKGYKKQMDRLALELDAFLEGVLLKRLRSHATAPRSHADSASDYLDLLLLIFTLDGRLDKQSVKSILLDLLGAGVETTMIAIEWAMAELMRNPDCMRKLQVELDAIAAATPVLAGSHLTNLPYLQAVIKETLRLHPPLSLNIRHMCKSLDTGLQVGPYHLPKKTRVLINLWSMGRDPTLWGEKAGSFCPDKFLTNTAPDFHGQHSEFLPFGTGRRGCPGMSLALATMSSVLANLVRGIHWKVPDEALLDLSEGSALTTPMAKPLLAIPILHCQ